MTAKIVDIYKHLDKVKNKDKIKSLSDFSRHCEVLDFSICKAHIELERCLKTLEDCALGFNNEY